LRNHCGISDEGVEDGLANDVSIDVAMDAGPKKSHVLKLHLASQFINYPHSNKRARKQRGKTHFHHNHKNVNQNMMIIARY
jgi:hypothetical protein